MNRLPICLLALLTGLFPCYGQAKAKSGYTFILPDGYIGWIQVVFNDPQALPFPVKKDGGRQIEVPESGIPRTSDLRVHDSKRKDEFYYRHLLPNGEAELRPVPPEYVMLGDADSHGGFGVMDTGGKGPGYSWFLFIGPPEIRAEVPLADWDKVIAAHTSPDGHVTHIIAPDTYPTPGRMPPAPPAQP